MKRILGVLILSTITSFLPAYAQEGLQVGKYYQGGVIYWLDPDRSYEHGLIADISDASSSHTTSYAWDTTPPSKTKATNDEVYTGKANTQLIITAIGSTRAQAASACVNSTKQGYSDWYLPSKKELALMFDTQAITKTAKAHGGAAFNNSPYWSSTQYFVNSAWNVTRSGGTYAASTYKKNILLSVRCIRAF